MDSQIGQSNSADDRNDDGLGIRLQVSVPLGRDRSLSAFARRQGERSSIGTAYDERVDETLNYQIRSDRDFAGHREHTLGGTLNASSRYAQVGLGLNRDSSSTSYSGQLQGAVVAHSEGFTLSPYRVEDTFGVVSVGEVAGARLTTPQGPVWTDPWGKAVIASLPAYQSSVLELEGKSLPRQMDIKNGTKVLEAGRGSFNRVDFEVIDVRRVLLRATDMHGKPLPQGAAVLGPENALLTTVVGDGMIFLSNVDAPSPLKSLPAQCPARCNSTFRSKPIMANSTKPLRRSVGEMARMNEWRIGCLKSLGLLLSGLLLAAPASAANCRLSLSQPIIDYGLLRPGEQLENRGASLGKRMVRLNVICVEAAVIALRFQGVPANETGYRFGRQGFST